MASVGKKAEVDKNVYELAVERTKYCFNSYDKVVVSFSGGKDSTAVLNVALAAAEELGKLPLDVAFIDEEAIPTHTVEYVTRVSKDPRLNFRWYCLPFRGGNACSASSTDWTFWDPAKKDLWVREMPEGAISSCKGLKPGEQGLHEFSGHFYGPEFGTVCWLLGIRTEESITRFRNIACRRGDKAYLSGLGCEGCPWTAKAYPVYDWRLSDVWFAVKKFGWDYNRAYDLFERVGISRHNQRVTPSFGEQTNHSLWTFKECWPELWDKMCYRVPGAATAARYFSTDLYGTGMKNKEQDGELPEGFKTWKSYIMKKTEEIQGTGRVEIMRAIRKILHTHHTYTKEALPDAEPSPLSGYCWRDLATMVRLGGNKFSRQTIKITGKAIARRVEAEANGLR